MNKSTDILREYETAFRDLVTFKNFNSNKDVKQTLRLNKREDWSFICSALDVIGDTTLAISNFLESGLEGQTDGNDFGEKYLRLYGVLNATYLQQFAIVGLYKKCNLTDPKDVIEKFKKLKIFELRNKLGAHSTEYSVGNGQVESYVIVRTSTEGHRLEFINNDSLIREWVDLKQYLEEHLLLIIDYLDKLYEKSIKTLHKGEESKIQEHMQKLSELRVLKTA